MRLILGDCLEKLKELEDNSVDSIVTDPPYGLSFMGKKWDYDVPSVEIWQECLRVLKPGGHLLAFSGTRTYHRIASAIEDAGFEVRDMIEWVYGSGFPKSLNIGKAVDKLQRNEREVVGEQNNGCSRDDISPFNTGDGWNNNSLKNRFNLTKGTSEWEGWGTALKPAHEPICMARKPLAEKTVAENCLKYGTGGINIDESRVEGQDKKTPKTRAYSKGQFGGTEGKGIGGMTITPVEHTEGRFPANLIHDGSDEVKECFPNESERFFKSIIYQAKASKSERNKGLDCYLTVKYNGVITDNNKTLCKEENMVAVQLLQKVISEQELVNFNIDESGVNIMVQCHKDSLSTILTEINRIIELKIYNSLMHSLTNESTQVANSEMEIGGNLAESVANLKRWILTITKGNQALALGASRVVCQMLQLISVEENWKPKTNIHSTVKPTKLMQYLVRLVTPKNGVVLDPFMGSGSTGKACKIEGFNFVGIELDEEYFKIAEARINNQT